MKQTVTGMRTPYEQAEPAGKAILKKATEDIQKRKADSKKGTYQAAKEAATFLVNQNKGKIMLYGGIGNGKYAYCLNCKSRVSTTTIQNKSCCKSCKSKVEWKNR